MIYLDNAATTFPKPPEVVAAATAWIAGSGGTPGRGRQGGARLAADVVARARRHLARFVDCGDERRVVFAYSATDALNLALKGVLASGDHVLVSGMEHNSVVRPLRGMERDGRIVLDVVPCDGAGRLDPDEVRRRLRPKTRLVVVTHASNVTGAVQPVAAVSRVVREHGALLLADAAQSAGVVPVSMRELGADLLALAGHKGLFGLQGTGGLVIGERVKDLRPLREGGTGFNSMSETQPLEWPEAFEAGTPNVPGIVALDAGMTYLEEAGPDGVELAHVRALWERLRTFDNVSLYGPEPVAPRTPVLAFNVRGWDPEDVAAVLSQTHGIQVRAGLHCAPLAHRTLGTLPAGCVRVSPGRFTTDDDMARLWAALEGIVTTRVP